MLEDPYNCKLGTTMRQQNKFNIEYITHLPKIQLTSSSND